jgi:hypothetical protein
VPSVDRSFKIAISIPTIWSFPVVIIFLLKQDLFIYVCDIVARHVITCGNSSRLCMAVPTSQSGSFFTNYSKEMKEETDLDK